jgi:hypothetical protein
MKTSQWHKSVRNSDHACVAAQVLAQPGTTFIRPGEGMLKSVRRIGERLSLIIEHEGREAFAGLELNQDQSPSLDAVEKVLRATLGKPIAILGALDV